MAFMMEEAKDIPDPSKFVELMLITDELLQSKTQNIDFIDFADVPTFRLSKKTKLIKVVRACARQKKIPPDHVRLWSLVARKNQTVRVHKPLKTLEWRLIDLVPKDGNRLKLFVETSNQSIPHYEDHFGTAIIFIKFFNRQKQAFLHVGHVVAQRSRPTGSLISLSSDEILVEEVQPGRFEDIPLSLSLAEAGLGSGDILVVVKRSLRSDIIAEMCQVHKKAKAALCQRSQHQRGGAGAGCSSDMLSPSPSPSSSPSLSLSSSPSPPFSTTPSSLSFPVVPDESHNRKLEEGFSCGICFEIMNWERLPRILPCRHSFCSTCLENIHSQGKCTCPFCRKRFSIDSIESLEVNHLIFETVDFLVSSKILPSSPEQPGEDYCFNFENCERRTQMFCSDCKLFVCDACDISHKSNMFTRNHVRKVLHNPTNDESPLIVKKKSLPDVCKEHSSEVVIGFCFECSVFVCVRCILGSHGKHKERVSPLKESAQKRRDQITSLSFELEERMRRIGSKQKTNEQELAYLEKQLKQIEEKIAKNQVEGKEMGLEMEDLKMRHDTIDRLSKTPSDDSILDEEVFSTLVQTAGELLRTSRKDHLNSSSINPTTKVRASCDGFQFVSTFSCGGEPSGVCVNHDGNLVIADGKSVKFWNRRESSVRSHTSPVLFEKPVSVGVGLVGQIVVLDSSKCQVMILNKEGFLTRSFGSSGSEPGQFCRPNGVTVDNEGRIIVADTGNNRVQVFSYRGHLIRCVGSRGSSRGQFACPMDVAVDPSGNIVVSDFLNHRIQVMDIEGRYIRRLGTKGSQESRLNFPRGVAVDHQGRIVVTDAGNKRVCVFESDGSHLVSFGNFEKPFGVDIDRFGSIIVSDYGKGVLQLWKHHS